MFSEKSKATTRENSPLLAKSLENNPLPQLASTMLPPKTGLRYSLVNSNCSVQYQSLAFQASWKYIYMQTQDKSNNNILFRPLKNPSCHI